MRYVAGSLVLVVAGCAAPRRMPPPPEFAEPPPAPRQLAAEPVLRIGVAWSDTSLAIGADGRWWVHEAGSSRPIAVVDGGESWRIVRLPFETGLRVARPDGFLSEPHIGPLEVAPLAPTAIAIEGTRYPGTIEVQARADGTLTGVNVALMEAYLEGVVMRELGRPGSSAYSALQAQAVAARTYALKRIGSRSSLGFDLYGTVLDQAYGGVPEAADSLAVRAVRETRGEALLYNGSLIDAFYHSTCGGHTAGVEDVFHAEPAQYLQAVSDERPDGGYWCQGSRYFRWTAGFDAAGLQATVSRNLPRLVPLPPGGVGDLRDIELLDATPEGRALSVRVVTSTGRYVVAENAIRDLFADDDERLLRSTLFLFRPVRVANRLVELTITGGGWGHGVGMCQVGAMGRARAGHAYRQILAAYYTGATVSTLYGS